MIEEEFFGLYTGSTRSKGPKRKYYPGEKGLKGGEFPESEIPEVLGAVPCGRNSPDENLPQNRA